MEVRKILEASDRTLSMLPLNGGKTQTGATLYVVGQLLALIPGLQFLAVPGVLEAIGTAVMSVGVAHRAIKKAIE